MNQLVTKVIFSFLFLILFSLTIHAQDFGRLDLTDTSQVHLVVLKNGNRLKGKIQSIDNSTVSFLHRDSTLTQSFLLGEIKKLRPTGNFLSFQKNFESDIFTPNILFFTNTALMLEPGQGTYHTYWGNSMNYSFHAKNAELGGGYSFPFFLNFHLKLAGKVKGTKNYSTGIRLETASAPISFLADDEIVAISKISYLNTWGSSDKFFNLAFNYFNIGIDDSLFGNVFFRYYLSAAMGGGFRINESFQFVWNNNVNFRKGFFDGEVIPSFGVSWTFKNSNIVFGYKSNNDVGLNFYPLFESDFDDFISFEKHFLARLPFFSYSRTL